MSRYERLLRLLVQTAAALLGLWIMFHAASTNSNQPWLYFAALIMMGLPGARTFASLVSLIGRIMDALRESEKRAKDTREHERHKDRD
jgi:ABC-type branched-subunit amino acid transport system permease subunit